MIVKEGSNFVVKSKDGKVLGRHKRKKDAIDQLVAIEINKKRRKAGYG